MILQSLRALAVREGLLDDSAFETKPVRWIIRLNGDGRFRQIYDTNVLQSQTAGSKKKPRLEAKLMTIPRRQVRSSGVKANFLVDNAAYVLGMDLKNDTPYPKTQERHSAYVGLLQTASISVESLELRAALAFLTRIDERQSCMEERRGNFADNDLFTFEVEGLLLHEVESLRHYWASDGGSPPRSGRRLQCLVCGELREVASLHNHIQIRGASTSGIPLVSFNCDAFEKYGWIGGANAPTCMDCMTAYVEGVRRLTRPRYVNPRSGKQVSPLHTVLTGDTTAMYWAENDIPMLVDLPLLRDDPGRLRDLLNSTRQGTADSVAYSSRFYCLILTGVQGRASVRRVHVATVADVECNLQRYFEVIDVDRFDRSHPLPQFRLLKSLAPNGDLERGSGEPSIELWLAALFHIALSRNFLAAVVKRNRIDQKVTPERAALLTLYFASRLQSANNPEPTEQISHKPKENRGEMSLNRESTDQPYLLGRLLAVLENLQTASSRGRGLSRTLVDRYFGPASARPSVVFPQLIQSAQHHFKKAATNARARALFLKKLLGEIMNALEPNGFAATLNLEQQGRFALGYYHQRESFYDSKPGIAGPASTSGTTRNTKEETAE
jgi:CRISPR-associated protein Csd1